jgi:hypothetical protein
MPTADYFRSQAFRCRRLAASTPDDRTARTLRLMADEYEEQALALDRGAKPVTIKPTQQ